MITVGLTLTRRGRFAVVEDGTVTAEAAIGDGPDRIPASLTDLGHTVEDVDRWAVADGPAGGGTLTVAGTTIRYASHPRDAALVALAYATSPFAGRDAAVLLWDGPARLHRIDAAGRHRPGDAVALPDLPALLATLSDADDLCCAGERAAEPEVTAALRAVVRELWIPPFPGDSGAAVGAAIAETGLRAVRWSARLGPEPVRPTHLPAGWAVSPCRPEELARALSRGAGPVVVLDGRAALGRGALGTRGILATTTHAGAAARLADRPTDLLCLAEHAADVVDPGFPDPYRQHRHRIRPLWTDRVAARPRDTTVRVQTVDAASSPTLATILREYRAWSGLPVLHHVPAPDPAADTGAAAAMRWGRAGLVWADGLLYRRKGTDA
ncbi:MAG TPA: carbamoyltransferase C-terminal domain-containing protein [Actinocatenispora sp.]